MEVSVVSLRSSSLFFLYTIPGSYIHIYIGTYIRACAIHTRPRLNVTCNCPVKRCTLSRQRQVRDEETFTRRWSRARRHSGVSIDNHIRLGSIVRPRVSTKRSVIRIHGTPCKRGPLYSGKLSMNFEKRELRARTESRCLVATLHGQSYYPLERNTASICFRNLVECSFETGIW